MLHKNLEVYKMSLDFCEKIYQLTEDFPIRERYGITSQMRRAAISVSSNIAEGSSRKGTKELIHFLYTSLSSLIELETQIEISKRLKYCNTSPIDLIAELSSLRRMLQSIIRKLNQKISSNS